MSTASLSFTVSVASSAQDVRDACEVRAQAYGHHLAAMQDTLAQPDALDRQAATAIVVCRDKRSGEAIGTARIVRSGLAPLQIEGSVILPHWLAEKPRAEITRLAVLPGADPQARLALMKASYLYCLASQVRWMVIGARSEALIRIYRRLGFQDVLAAGDRVPLAHAGNLPHCILFFDVLAAERTWLASGHGLYAFMCDTYHPDLRLFPQDAHGASAGGSELAFAA